MCRMVDCIGGFIFRILSNGVCRWGDDFGVWIRKRTRGYREISKYKNLNDGERCFIVASGPSLTKDDLEMIRGEISFGMNSIVAFFDQTNWRPTFLGIQDYAVYKKIDRYYRRLVNTDGDTYPVIFASNKMMRKTPELRNKCVVYPLHLLNHRYYKNLTPEVKFSDRADIVVYDGFSITYSLLQIAIYMGFEEIYLLGCDCDYSTEQKHFVEHGHTCSVMDSFGELSAMVFSKARQYADDQGIRIFNATRGGKLEVFPRVNLDEVL